MRSNLLERIIPRVDKCLQNFDLKSFRPPCHLYEGVLQGYFIQGKGSKKDWNLIHFGSEWQCVSGLSDTVINPFGGMLGCAYEKI